MTKNITLKEAKFRCPKCKFDALSWPGDLLMVKKLTGEETPEEAVPYLRCKRCQVQVEVNYEADYPQADNVDTVDMRGKVLFINKNRYSALIKVQGKLVIACSDIRIILEGDDRELSHIAWGLAHDLEINPNGTTVIQLAEGVSAVLG